MLIDISEDEFFKGLQIIGVRIEETKKIWDVAKLETEVARREVDFEGCSNHRDTCFLLYDEGWGCVVDLDRFAARLSKTGLSPETISKAFLVIERTGSSTPRLDEPRSAPGFEMS